jgi:hypothetical protein
MNPNRPSSRGSGCELSPWCGRARVARGHHICGVEIAFGKDMEDADHLIMPAERLRVAMAWQ